MTCPVTIPQALDDAETSDAGDLFERVAGSSFVGLFAAGLFDQAMLPAVSAALEATGRIRNQPWWRAVRSAASDQLVFHGATADRQAEAERLVRLHRDVKGVGANGIRYSALNPESWNWILISTFFVYRNAFTVITGKELSAADNQAVWDRFRLLTADLQLSGRSALIDDYDELCAYYGHIVAEKLETTATLECAVASVLHPPRPDFVPAVVAPLWRLASPMAGHVIAVIGFGTMHPGVRDLVPMSWSRRHDVEFAALSGAITLAYRWLPARLTDTPLARNRRQYERIVAKYQGVGLTSFAPDPVPTTI